MILNYIMLPWRKWKEWNAASAVVIAERNRQSARRSLLWELKYGDHPAVSGRCGVATSYARMEWVQYERRTRGYVKRLTMEQVERQLAGYEKRAERSGRPVDDP